MSEDPFASDRRAPNNHRIEIAKYDPLWPGLALVESARLANALGASLIRVEHLGSTAVPGLAAKPIIDLFPVVTSLEELDRRQRLVEELGYEWRGEFGIPARRYCTRDISGVRRFHLHCFPDEHENLVQQRTFRDYLRSHADEARAYEAVKREAAAANPNDMLAYNDAKSDWIQAAHARAAAWKAT